MEWYNIAFVVVLIIVGIVVYRNKKNEYQHPSEQAKSPRENLMWVIFSLKNLEETQKYFIFAREMVLRKASQLHLNSSLPTATTITISQTNN